MRKIMIALAFSISLYAGWKSGNDLVNDMSEYKKYNSGQNYNYVSAGIFSGYVTGVRDTLLDLNLICIPAGANGNQIFHVVIKYVDNNPSKWNKSATLLVGTALLDAFPCEKKK